MAIDKKLRETAARVLLKEIISLNSTQSVPSQNPDSPLPNMDGKLLATLLDSNFAKIDQNNNGISRQELALALANPQYFSSDEYNMLRLVSKYFEAIASICDDQEKGQQLVITIADKEVLLQFLLHSNMSLQDISDWLALNDRSMAPPPASA